MFPEIIVWPRPTTRRHENPSRCNCAFGQSGAGYQNAPRSRMVSGNRSAIDPPPLGVERTRRDNPRAALFAEMNHIGLLADAFQTMAHKPQRNRTANRGAVIAGRDITNGSP